MRTTVIIPAVAREYVSFRLCALVEALCHAGIAEPQGGFGGLYGYGIDFENEVFTMRQHDECTCGAQDEDGGGHCIPTCPWNLPQFKCGAFEVRWHKYIGRSMEVELGGLGRQEIVTMFDRCERSLKP